MKFSTADVIGTTTGRLLGDIGGIYKVTSFLIGRDAYTHELVYYGRRASAAIKAALPDIPVEADARHVNGENYRQFLAECESKFGDQIDLPESLRDCLADEKNCVGTAGEMVGPDNVIAIET